MQLVSIQYLRALAALMVVVFHSHSQLARMGLETGWMDSLAAGVDVFFAISGLIMWITTAQHPTTPRDFWLRRLIRIVPPYWLLTGVMVAATLIVPGVLRTSGFDPRHVVASFLFLPHPHPVTGELYPLLIPGWTLNYEMAFYALFGLGLLLPPSARFLAVGAVLMGVALAAKLVPEPGRFLRFYGADIVLEFWWGMAIGVALQAGRLPGPRAGIVLLLGGLAMLPGGWALSESWPRGLVVGIPAALAILGALAVERGGRVPVRRFPLLLGDASYALYLSHVIVLAAVAAAWKRLPEGGWISGALFMAVGTAATIAVAIPLFRWMEKPVRQALHAWIPLRTGTPAPSGPPLWARRQARAE